MYVVRGLHAFARVSAWLVCVDKSPVVQSLCPLHVFCTLWRWLCCVELLYGREWMATVMSGYILNSCKVPQQPSLQPCRQRG
jgi:hypothetical protein